MHQDRKSKALISTGYGYLWSHVFSGRGWVCQGGGYVQRGGWAPTNGHGTPGGEYPPPPRDMAPETPREPVGKQAVPILLECHLVIYNPSSPSRMGELNKPRCNRNDFAHID